MARSHRNETWPCANPVGVDASLRCGAGEDMVKDPDECEERRILESHAGSIHPTASVPSASFCFQGKRLLAVVKRHATGASVATCSGVVSGVASIVGGAGVSTA